MLKGEVLIMNNKQRLLDLQEHMGLLAQSMDNVDLEIQACHELNESPEKYYKIHDDMKLLIDNVYETTQQIIDRLDGLAHYQLPPPRRSY